MSRSVVLFGEEDTLFRLMETALNETLSPTAEKALHYFFGEDISKPIEYLKGVKAGLGLPHDMEGVVCDDGEKLARLMEDADFLVVEHSSVTGDMLRKSGNRLKLIQKFGSDLRPIDTDAATRFGIPVATFSRMSTISVAEHVILLILALARNIVKAHQTAMARGNAGDASRSEGPPRTLFNWGRVPNIELVSGKSLGLVGFGEIGQQVASRARALGMDVNYYRRNRMDGQTEERAGVRYISTLFELMEISDFVSLHIPYNPQTEKIITYEVLSSMKPGAYLINVSRGGLVDEKALHKVLSEKRISGAALDVYRWEPIPQDSPLLRLDTLVWSTHNAGGAPEFMLEESRGVLENIGRVVRGEEPKGWVNRA